MYLNTSIVARVRDRVGFHTAAPLPERHGHFEPQNKLGLDEIPTLNYGGVEDDDADSEGGEGGAEAAAEKTIFKVKVTEFGKSKVKVRPIGNIMAKFSLFFFFTGR